MARLVIMKLVLALRTTSEPAICEQTRNNKRE
jgi:hypothetical protein